MNSSVYQAYLTTGNQDINTTQPPNQPTNKLNKANVTWAMNWNELFRNNNINGKYKKCRLRYNLISGSCNTVIATGLGYQSGTTFTVTNFFNGAISVGGTMIISTVTETIVSFGTGTGGLGTYQTNTSATIGSVVSPVTFIVYTNWNLANCYVSTNLQSNNSLSTTQNGTILGFATPQLALGDAFDFFLYSNTTNEPGVDIIIPQGTQPFTISLYNHFSNKFFYLFNDYNYEIMLYFELYN